MYQDYEARKLLIIMFFLNVILLLAIFINSLWSLDIKKDIGVMKKISFYQFSECGKNDN